MIDGDGDSIFVLRSYAFIVDKSALVLKRYF